MDKVIVGLSSWIIQDGNYPDFVRGQHAAFALEFWPTRALSACAGDVAPAHSFAAGTSTYDISGTVIHLADDWWAIDCGFLAFREERPPADIRQGQCVRGEISIWVDPYFYFEQLSKREDSPALICDWIVEKIEIQTAPLVEVAPRRLQRDQRLLGWREIERTDGWTDDGGLADYRLHCARVNGAFRHTKGKTA